MTINSQQLTLAAFLQTGRLAPASVQRAYQWGAPEADRLLSDLLDFMHPLGFAPASSSGSDTVEDDDDFDEWLEADGDGDNPPCFAEEIDDAPVKTVVVAKDYVAAPPKTPPRRNVRDVYFLGQMVVLPAPKARDLDYLYDGLQRSTTILVLLATLRRTLRDPDHPLNGEIAALLLSDQEADRRRLHIPNIKRVFALLIGGSAVHRVPHGFVQERRLLDVRDAFLDRIAPWSDAERAMFLQLLLERVVIIRTEVSNRSVAYQMFVGANARGKHLDIGDVLKGRMIEVIDRGAGAMIAERYAKKWTDLSAELRSHFARVLKASEFIRYRETASYQPGELLLQAIDDAEERDSDPTAVAEELRGWIDGPLSDHANSYQRLTQHYREPFSHGADIALRRLSFLGWDEWLPVAMEIDLHCLGNARRRAGLMHALQRSCYVLHLLSWDENGRRSCVAEAIIQLRSGDDPFRSRYRDGTYGALAVSRGLRAAARQRLAGPLAAPELRGPLVRLLETLGWGWQSLPRSCTNDADVEHILPQAHRGDWADTFSKEDYEWGLHRLGNLVILDKGANRDLQTDAWPRKRAVYREHADEFKTAADAARYDEWTIDALRARHETVVSQVAESLRL